MLLVFTEHVAVNYDFLKLDNRFLWRTRISCGEHVSRKKRQSGGQGSTCRWLPSSVVRAAENGAFWGGRGAGCQTIRVCESRGAAANISGRSSRSLPGTSRRRTPMLRHDVGFRFSGGRITQFDPAGTHRQVECHQGLQIGLANWASAACASSATTALLIQRCTHTGGIGQVRLSTSDQLAGMISAARTTFSVSPRMKGATPPAKACAAPMPAAPLGS